MCTWRRSACWRNHLVDKYLVGRLDAPFIVLSTLDAMAVTGRLVVDMVIPGGAVPGGAVPGGAVPGGVG